MKKIVGNVDFAEYEDGKLEYLATIKKQPYVDMVREQSKDVKGVSIEANYLDNVCPECGERFYSEESFSKHMKDVHLIETNPTLQPHGIHYTALSLVLTPEVPGVSGTTVELMETANDQNRLFEMVIANKEPSENEEHLPSTAPLLRKGNTENLRREASSAHENTLPATHLPVTIEFKFKVLEKLIRQQRSDYEHIIAAVDKRYSELKEEKVDLEERLKIAKKQLRINGDQLQFYEQERQDTTKLKESFNQKIEELSAKYDNLEFKLKGNFKAHSSHMKNKKDVPIQDEMRTA